MTEVVPGDGKKLVSSLVWRDWPGNPGEYFLAQGDAVKHLGYRHDFFRYDEKIPSDTDIVLIQGPYETLLPLVQQFIGRPLEDRPIFVYWFQQSLSLPRFNRTVKPSTRMYSDLHQYYGESGLIGNAARFVAPEHVATRGRRLGFLGDIFWLNRHGLLDVLALSSTVYANYLEQFNIPSVVVPRGYHPSYGEKLNLERDIAAVWMGKLRTRRRRSAIYWIRDQLQQRGLDLRIYDGEENDFIFGPKRTEILNRTRFVLNVYFSGPTDELSIRFFVSGSNGAVILTEPGLNKYPFVPGEHIVECPIEEMPDMIEYYIEHEDKWLKISNRMLDLMRNELTLDRSMATILAQAEHARNSLARSSGL